MPVLESTLLSLTVENNDTGQWAVFIRCQGRAVQVTQWTNAPLDAVNAFAHALREPVKVE